MNLQRLLFRHHRERGLHIRAAPNAATTAETAFSKFVQIEHGNDRIVHVEQQAQTIALFLELLLNRLRLFEVKRVVHCHRYLASYLLQENHIGL